MKRSASDQTAVLAACIRTLASPRWKIWLASWFGRRRAVETASGVVILATWRGRDYWLDSATKG